MNRSTSVMKVPLRGKSCPRKSHFKCAIVGDSKSGKTSLIRSYATNLTFPYTVQTTRPAPTQYPVKKAMKGEEYTATFTDTNTTDLEKRITAYKGADAIIVCFSLVNQTSFKNVKDKWLKEVQAYCSNTPVILVGTKSDLVHNPNIKKKDIVTTKQVDKLLENHFIHEYCESSALTKDGLDIVIDEAFQAAWIGPVRYVYRMKTVKPSVRLRLIFLPCLFRKSKTA